MALLTELSLDDAVAHIDKGVGGELEKQIKAALMPHAEKVVEEAAKRLCQNLKANMTSYRQQHDERIQITLVIDGARHEI